MAAVQSTTTTAPQRILMGPGPSDVDSRVLAALSAPIVGHLDPYFLGVMDEMQSMLREVFRTKNELTLAVSGTGSAGMETCVVNLIEPGDRMVVGVNGVFGTRMADVAARAGAEVTTIERPFGEVFDADEIAEVVARVKPKVVGLIHAETSTGALQPIEEISRVVHDAGALLLLDTVTSLGGVPVEIDAWNVDAVYSGTQKCLSCPPGLAPVSFSAAALEVMDARKTKVASWYLDMSMVRNYWGGKRAYHHTAPINMNYALHEALRLVLEEGLENRFARHRQNHLALCAGLEALGIQYAVPADHRLPQLNAVVIPEGVDDAAVRKQLLGEFGIEIGGGLGPMAGKTWRIGLMGAASSNRNVLLLLAALERCLTDQGISITPGAGVAAANGVYGDA
ncbi:Purine catabolism protein PucG [Symmachiella dynata]|uniref:pyridoxal-phosphate-dependent aminotransferase family protein n=1 Tax=Symmachiella dynata TaxID=2527995 RepID=UPI00118A51A7|nr:alanine--glyoxylate aminotransferase family protein [Symmachiella dynata]QDT46886.1 Purine catabolism protein PucG [Symmachiella dynata]